KLPFSAPSVMLLLEAHLKKNPTPPTIYNSLIPVEMEEVILKLLEKEPQRRFGYALEVAQRIKRILEDFRKGEVRVRTQETVAVEVKLPEQLLKVPWTGKKEELKKLLFSIEELKKRKGKLINITGEHGSGKSRFLEEVKAKAVEEGFFVFSGQSKEEVPYPFYLFEKIAEEIFRKHRKIVGGEGELLLQFFPELQKQIGLEEGFRTLPQIDPKGEKARLFYGFYSLIKSLGEKKPVVFLFDDLQWADSSSLELLNHLIYMCLFSENPIPVLFCLSFIDEEVSQDQKNLFYKYKNRAENIFLKPFNREELQEFVQGLLYSPEPLPMSFLDSLLNQSGGNPFFVMEIIRALIDEGILKRASVGMNWVITSIREVQRATISLERLKLPDTIKENLMLRLRKYSEKEVSLLQIAAMIGKKFPFMLWKQITGSSEEELLDLAEKLLKDKIFREHPGEVLEFVNDQIRKILIEGISDLKRRRMQGRVADGILSHYKEIPEELYFTLAQNLEEAGRGQEAKPFYRKLAEKAKKVYDLPRAEDLWMRYLELSLEDERAGGFKNLGDVMAYSGRFTEAENYYRKALEVAGEEDYFDIKIALGSLYGQKGDYRKMSEIIEEILRELEGKGKEMHLGWAYYYWGIVNYQMGKQEEALEVFKKSLEIFEKLENVEGILAVYGTMGAPYFLSGRIEEAVDILKKGLQLSENYGDFRRKLLSLTNLISLNLNLGDYEKAQNFIEEALKLSSAIGDLRIYAHILYQKGLLLKWEGNLKEGIEFLNRASSLGNEISAKEIYSNSLISLSTGFMEENNFEEALKMLKEAKNIAESSNLLILLPLINFLLFYLDFVKGDRENLENLNKTFEEIKKGGDPYDFAECSVYYSRVLKKEGNKNLAVDILQEALKVAQEKNYKSLIKRIEAELASP
ncbi:MAG: tetratricopeptide repeat protein, partial [Thermoanaerobaculia bacterium]